MERLSLLRHLSGWLATAVVVLARVVNAADAPKTAETHRVVLLAPSGPLILSIQLETGSQSIRQVRDSFCDALFKRLDADSSGNLETSEQALLPMFKRTGGSPSSVAQSFLTDGVMTEDGMKKYIDDQLGPLFSVEMKAPRADQTVRLLDALDLDHDGVLSVDEVVNSAKALSRYDLDDDESLSVSELQPFPQSVRQAQRQQAVQEGRGSRAFLIEKPADAQAAVTELWKLLALKSSIDVARCGLKPGAAAFDSNKDGSLDAEEIKRWMVEAPADLEVKAMWRELGRGLPPVLEMTAPRTPRLVPGKTVSRRQWDASVDGVTMQLSLFDNRGFASNSVSLFVTKALTLDRDKNGYLDEAEFAGLGTTSPFSAVDLNHDGMVKTDEIRQYFQSVSQLSQTRVVMSFSDDVMSLFQLMDSDKSNRLSPREMLTLRDRILPYDRNSNGVFDPGDFTSAYKLMLSFSVPEGMNEELRTVNNGMGTTGGVKGTFRSGPIWYQRMDRNRDHDISWREFLGPRTKFDEVDTDHDGLISREEAEAADAKAKASAAESQPASAVAPTAP